MHIFKPASSMLHSWTTPCQIKIANSAMQPMPEQQRAHTKATVATLAQLMSTELICCDTASQSTAGKQCVTQCLRVPACTAHC